MVFNTDYSRLYDVFYADKDYPGECDLVEEICQRTKIQPRKVLDLGCGTGGHARELARRGWQVTGVDRSKSMLAIARGRTEGDGLIVKFVHQDLRELEIDGRYDLAIAMFAVVGYLTENSELKDFFRRVRKLVDLGGIFVFDCWYGPAVLTQKPQTVIHDDLRSDGTEVIRMANPGLDVFRHTVAVNYRVLELKDSVVRAEFTEEHTMRFFFPREVEFLLNSAGFEHVEFHPFGDLGRCVDEKDWNLLVIAR